MFCRLTTSFIARVFAAGALIAMMTASATPAQATPTPLQETLTISGVHFVTGLAAPNDDAGSLSGTLAYHYNPTTGAVTSVDYFSLVKTAGCCLIGGYDYEFHMPGVTDTATVTVDPVMSGIVVTSSLFHIQSVSPNSPQMFLDIVGSGTGAYLAVHDPVTSSAYTCSGTKGGNCFGLGSIGTTLAVTETVPEPASLALLGAGLLGLAGLRRRG